MCSLQQRPLARRHRAKFLPEEDAKLKSLIAEYGDRSWDVIAKNMAGRNQRQCRERWKHYLSGSSEWQKWTREEDIVLCEKVKEFGPKWTKISKFLPGKTDIQLKSRWNKLFSRNTYPQYQVQSQYFYQKPQVQMSCMPTFVPVQPEKAQMHTTAEEFQDILEEFGITNDSGTQKVGNWNDTNVSPPVSDGFDL